MIMRIQNEHYAIEVTESEHTRIYHSKLCLLHEGSEQVARANVNEAWLEFELSPVLRIVLDIPGVEVARIFAYKIAVQKSPMFEWEEIEPQIVNLLRGVELAREAPVQAETEMCRPATARSLAHSLESPIARDQALRKKVK